MISETKNPQWKSILLAIILTAIVVAGGFFLAQQFSGQDRKTAESKTSEETETPKQTDTTSIDDMMNDFQGTNEEVVQICETELKALNIDYVSIDEPLDGSFIQETRVGTYELNGILRTPSTNPDMPYPRSTEMLCTIFPDDEYPVEITFGKDW